jgi:hypothetical protein
MKTTTVISGVMVACMMALSAGSAHAIAFMNPTKTQVKAAETQVRKDVKANSAIYGKGAKIKISYTAGQPTIGPDRSHVQPQLNVLITGKKGAMGMANNHEGLFTIGVAGKGAKNVSVQQDGNWTQLDTVVAPAK